MKISIISDTPNTSTFFVDCDGITCYFKTSKKGPIYNYIKNERWKRLSTLEELGSDIIHYVPARGVYNGIDALLTIGGKINKGNKRRFTPKVIRRKR
jgi:hypothetical protein